MYRLPYVVFLILIALLPACDKSVDPVTDSDVINNTIKSGDIFEYHTGMGGDEQGASIIVQPKHYQISEMVRNADTNWEAVYRYQPASRFKGTVYVELELVEYQIGAGTTLSRTTQQVKLQIVVQ